MSAATPRLARQQSEVIAYALRRLGFRDLQTFRVSFQRVVNTLADYEQYRQAGLAHRLAVECLLFGDGWLRHPRRAPGTAGLADDL